MGGFYTVRLAEGETLVCRQRGKLRKKEAGLFPGDWVRVSRIPAAEKAKAAETGIQGMIEETLPRRNFLLRPKVANIDIAVVVLAAGQPAPDWLLLDRILAMCLYHQIQPLVCLNKWDCLTAAEAQGMTAALAPYHKIGMGGLPLSAQNGLGIAELQARLQGKTAVFAGPSGVGKSSLLNALAPGLCLPTGQISERLRRGKHTTRHVEMLPLPGNTFIADTPGFSLLDLPKDLQSRILSGLYPEFQGLPPCRFEGCLHDKEPDCAVKAALAAGHVDIGRYERYLRLLAEAREREERYYD